MTCPDKKKDEAIIAQIAAKKAGRPYIPPPEETIYFGDLINLSLAFESNTIQLIECLQPDQWRVIFKPPEAI